MAFRLTVTPDQLADAADVAERLAFERNVVAMLAGVTAALKDTITQMLAGTTTGRSVTFNDEDYDSKGYTAVAERLRDAGFRVELKPAVLYESSRQLDEPTLVISC